jgi:thiamine pyrophosphate-dependent acetolactate synthase large subunit-like protein
MIAPKINTEGMSIVAALQVLIDLRTDGQIVITNQASARIWPKLADHRLDCHYNPSAMGGAIPLAVGLALAQPQRNVLVVSGDGSLLMSLGSLVTAATSGAANLTIVVLDNRLYEVTGGQKTPATDAAVDLPTLATAAGLKSASGFAELSDWRNSAGSFLQLPGPRFVSLRVSRTPPEYMAFKTPPIADQLERLRATLSVG